MEAGICLFFPSLLQLSDVLNLLALPLGTFDPGAVKSSIQTLRKPGECGMNGDLHFCLTHHPVFSFEEPRDLSTPCLVAQAFLTQQKASWFPGDTAGSICAILEEQPTEAPCPPLPTSPHCICPGAAGGHPCLGTLPSAPPGTSPTSGKAAGFGYSRQQLQGECGQDHPVW